MHRELEAKISSNSAISARHVRAYYARDKRKQLQVVVLVIVSALIGWGVGLLNPLAGLIVGLVLGICGLFGPVWITYHHEE
jgi:hypothetical protein